VLARPRGEVAYSCAVRVAVALDAYSTRAVCLSR